MTALTPELAERIIISVRNGTPPRQAMLAAGISDQTMSAWRRVASGELDSWPGTVSPVQPDTKVRIQKFVRDIAEAQAACMEMLHNQLVANATTINPKTGHSDTQALREVLGKHPGSRQDWYENKHQVVEQTVTHRREDQLTESASMDELEAWSELALPEPK